jgi:hypothetical protein
MNSAFSTAIPDSSLAAIGQLSENSRLGFASRNPALHRGIEWSKSTLALGLPEWSGKTASDHVVAANNGVTATISAGPPDAKKNYCLHQSNMAGLEAVLPGGHVLLGNDYSPSAVLGSVAEVSSHIGPEVLAGSTALKYSIRSSTGIPMSVAENIFKGLGYFALAVTGYSALSASQHEYQACMAW